MSAVFLVTWAGAAAGSRAAAAALACAGAEPDRAGLLIDLRAPRAPRPSLIASAAARELEERLAAHLPEADVASRGQTCHLRLAPNSNGLERAMAALPIARDSIGAIHLPPGLLQPALAEPLLRPSGVLLRADLGESHALTALAVGDLMGRGAPVAVLKRSLGWIASRRALAGALPPGGGGAFRQPAVERLLEGAPESRR